MIKPITSVKVKNKRVIVRAGFDLPLAHSKHTGGWVVADNTRIQEGLDTIKYLIENKAKIIIVSKLGRPKKWESKLSMWPVAEELGKLLDYKVVEVTDKLPNYKVPHVYFLRSDITKKDHSGLSHEVPPGSILFLENLQFYPGEVEEAEKFTEILEKYGDIYVNEAFSSAHRKTASTYDLAKKLPSYAGTNLLKEISALNRLLKDPKQPFVVMIGGAKIEDKIATIDNLAQKAAYVLLGGAIANTFLKALGYNIGRSKASDPAIAKQLLRNYKHKLILPLDYVVADGLESKPRVVTPDKILAHDLILDIGPQTIRKFSSVIKEAKTLAWNGPFGLIEYPKFAFGSKSMAHIFGARSTGHAYGVIGGGETIEAVNMAKMAQYIDHISSGGGAMLEFLSGKKLPAIKVLEGK